MTNYNIKEEINRRTIWAGHAGAGLERWPEDPYYKSAITRDTLSKYWLMGKRDYTEYDAK